MAKGIEVGIASETKAFKQGVETGIISPLEDALSTLDDLGKAKGPQALEKALKDVQAETERLKKETARTADDIDKQYRQSYKKVGDNAKDAFKRAERGAEDFKSEASQSMRETAASISSVEDGLDAVQEIAANAFSGFGPAGVAAGLVAATGIGFISEALGNASEAADETKARIRSMYEDAASEGRSFLDEAQINAEALSIIYDEDQSRYNTAMKDSRELGLPWQELVRAMAGDQEALNTVLERTNALEEARNERITNSTSPLTTRKELMTSEGQTLDEINGRYTAQKTLIDESATRTEQWLATQQASTEELQKQNKRLADMPKTLPVALTVDTTALDNELTRARSVRVTVDSYNRDGTRIR